MKKFTSYISGKRNLLERKRSDDLVVPEGDSPEANIVRGVKLFCEAGNAENPQGQGEEVLHLPVIVEAAESSPAAAALAAQHIRKYISMNNSSRPHTQYNAVMLIRILADNPGPTFTRNIDEKFVSAVKGVLRNSKDPSVQQIIRETLTSLYRDKAYDEYLAGLFAMWSKESGQRPNDMSRQQSGQQSGQLAGTYPPPPPLAAHPHSGSRSRIKQLPPPDELAARIEEAKTSAKLLQQLVQSTPQGELKGNDLVSEFAERCQSAQRSIQGYINADNPAADDETMQTLIETSEQLSLSLSKHSRALLQARRAAGAAGTSPTPPHSTSPDPPSLPVRHGLGLSAAAEQRSASNASHGELPPQAPYGQPPPQAPYGQLPPQAPYGQPEQTPYNQQPNVSPLQHHPVGGFDSYSPPPMQPASSISRKAAPVPATVAPVPDPPAAQMYSPPPMPPPSQARESQISANRPPIPAGLPPSTTEEDPFSDRHTAPEDTATALPSTSGLAHSGALDRPGFSHVTPSYVRRQDSSEAHYTMHGAVESPPSSPPRTSETSRFYSGAARTGEVSPITTKHDGKIK